MLPRSCATRPAIRAAAGLPARPPGRLLRSPPRRKGKKDGLTEMEKHNRRFRRPTWGDIERMVQIACKLADEAARLILAIHGVR
jgi:hypothetical protein